MTVIFMDGFQTSERSSLHVHPIVTRSVFFKIFNICEVYEDLILNAECALKLIDAPARFLTSNFQATVPVT